MLETLLTTLFISGSILIVYHHVGYPFILRTISKWLKPARHLVQEQRHLTPDQQQAGQDQTTYPSVTIVVPAFNEQRWIADKIRNLAALDYPKDLLKIIVVNDGSKDNTVGIAQAVIQEAICDTTYFEIHDHQDNQGKVARINQTVSSANSDIIALSDVSALISIDALKIAAKHFANPRVGVVNSGYQLLDSDNSAEVKYWQYQQQIKQCEADIGASLGAHGAFYLFRKALFTPLPSNTINDDFILPMQIVKQGYLAKYDTQIVALELETTTSQADFQRRLRISAGNMQQLILLRGLFSPKYGAIAFTLFSGKGLRLLTPYLMIICLMTSALLTHNPIFLGVFLGQIILYVLTIATHNMTMLRKFKTLVLLHYLISGHFANFIGGLRYLTGKTQDRWTKVNV
jgi:cellulose synthase/poly-beta-1,6-N-acetylglucosamine synthase-like glycosyltransferase